MFSLAAETESTLCPEQPENTGMMEELSPELPARWSRGEGAVPCPAAQPLAGFFSWGCSLKSKVWEGTAPVWLPHPRHQDLAVSSHPCVSGWLRSGMPQLGVCRHRHSPTATVPLCCLFALLIVCFSPALKHQGDGNHAAPLARSPRWALAGAAWQEPPVQQGQLGSLPTPPGSAAGCTICSRFPLQLLLLTVMGSER